MTGSPPAASCTLSPEGTVTTVPVGARCKVTYEFDTSATSTKLAIPYVVSVDGQVLPEHAHLPAAVRDTRTIVLSVKPGSRIALYLNSDVHPDHRRQPVYALQVGKNDVHIRITEQTGRIGHEYATLGMPRCQQGAGPGKYVDVYEAVLTGDIWMKVSHLYTVEEADAMLPDDTTPTVRVAVRSIYAGLARPELIVDFPASHAAPKMTLKVVFQDEMQGNVRANTTHCPWLKGILPRTHPCAFAALLTEARAAGVTSVAVTSGWRPSLGSIAHRAGLGLDITYIESGGRRVLLNRAGLINARAAGNGNVSEREKQMWREYQAAKEELAVAETVFNAAQSRAARGRTSGNRAAPDGEVKDSKERLVRAKERVGTARDDWNSERNANEPTPIRNLRETLSKNSSVGQLFDPWYMDANTADHIAPIPNEQRRSNINERLHNNHLHITVRESKILRSEKSS